MPLDITRSYLEIASLIFPCIDMLGLLIRVMKVKNVDLLLF